MTIMGAFPAHSAPLTMMRMEDTTPSTFSSLTTTSHYHPTAKAAAADDDAGESSSAMMLLVNRIYRASLHFPRPHDRRRSLQTDAASSCSEDPFLWLIQKQNSSSSSQADEEEEAMVVGFAVGSMHLPRDLIVSNDGWNSLTAAASDACAIYGEVDVTDPEIIQDITACSVGAQKNWATLNDIPDEALRSEYATIMNNIANEYMNGASTIAESFMELPILVATEMISVYNTPSYKDTYFAYVFSAQPGTPPPESLDVDLLELGRPSGGLETVQESCDLFDLLWTRREDFRDQYDEIHAQSLRRALNVSYTPYIENYACGNSQTISNMFGDDLDSVPPEIADGLLDVRNRVMADRMIKVLESSGHKPMFVIGFAHWMEGSSSLESLLQQEGYTLKAVNGSYDPNLFPDVTDDTCSEANDSVSFEEEEEVEGSTSGVSYTKMNVALVIAAGIIGFVAPSMFMQ